MLDREEESKSNPSHPQPISNNQVVLQIYENQGDEVEVEDEDEEMSVVMPDEAQPNAPMQSISPNRSII
jgi:hypothetical protein